jgi:hypothetical protein
MAISKFVGVRELPLFLFADSQLERNRFVTITKSTLKSAYTTYGSIAEGVILARGHAENFENSVMPLDFVDRTFFVTLARAAAQGDPVFPTVDGKGTTKSYDVVNANSYATPSPSGASYYIVPAGGWSSANNNSLAYYNGSAWSYTTVADAIGVVVYNSQNGKYYISNGTAWVTTKIACYAGAAGAVGADIACFVIKKPSIISAEDLPTTLIGGARVVAAGLSASETDADATITVTNSDILATDFATATLKAAANAVYVTKAVCTAGTLTITLSGNGGAGTIVNYAIFR